MSVPQPIYRNTPAHPELRDVLDLWKRDALLSTNCHALATVQSFTPNDTTFTPARPTVQAQINYCRVVFDEDSNGVPQWTPVAYPPLVNVPVLVLSGGGGGAAGGGSLTFPVAKGDQCLILFNDRSLDGWAQGATSGPPTSPRVHHLSDGIALVGFPVFTASGNIGPQYSPDHVLLSGGAAQVGCNPGSGKVLITNDPTHTTNLNTLLQNLINQLKSLCTAIESITVTCAGSGSPSSVPINAASFVTISNSIASIATALGGMLE